MQRRQKELVAHLLDAFPPREFQGDVVGRDFPRRSEMQEGLGGSTWWSVPDAFVAEHANDLPCLSEAAYLAFLPAWLCEAVRNPTGELARQVRSNLAEGALAHRFSSQQCFAVAQIARWLCENNELGEQAPENLATMEQVRRRWGEHGA